MSVQSSWKSQWNRDCFFRLRRQRNADRTRGGRESRRGGRETPETPPTKRAALYQPHLAMLLSACCPGGCKSVGPAGKCGTTGLLSRQPQSTQNVGDPSAEENSGGQRRWVWGPGVGGPTGLLCCVDQLRRSTTTSQMET
jgi:hypothetical protein